MTLHRAVLLSDVARYAPLGVPVFRLFLGVVLVWGTIDNVTSHERMLEFRDFLASNGFPYPLLCARVSAWAQFLSGLAFVAGAATRLAAALMIVNFAVALAMVHAGLPFSANIAPLAMLFGALLLFLHGPGAWALDGVLEARASRHHAAPETEPAFTR